MTDPLYQLWQLRQYLRRMRDEQTVLVRADDKSREFGFTEKRYQLGDDFGRLKYSLGASVAMADIGLDPMERGTVYGYIERRHPAFVNPYYGWGVDR